MKKGYILSAMIFGLMLSSGLSFTLQAAPQVQVSVGVPVGNAGYAGLYLDDSGIMMQMNLTPGQRAQYMKVRDKHYKKWAKQARKEAKYREKARRAYLNELRRYLAPAQFTMFNQWAIGPGSAPHPGGHMEAGSAPRPGGHMGPAVPAPKPKPMYTPQPPHKDKGHKPSKSSKSAKPGKSSHSKDKHKKHK